MGTDRDGGGVQSEEDNLPVATDEGTSAPDENLVRAKLDYSIHKVGTELRGINLTRGMEARFGEDGQVKLNRISHTEKPFDVEIKVTGYGRSGSVRAVGGGSIEPGKCFGTGERGCDDTLVIERPHFSEWYINDPDGLEQGFIITERPGGEGELIIEMSIEGSYTVVFKEGERIVFGVDSPAVAPFGPRIYYEDLVIHGGSGKTVKGDIELSGREIRLVVPDENLDYPLYVDPYFRTDYWKKYGDYNYANFGMSLAAGDFDGNGCDDLAVGSPHYTNGQTYEGMVKVFYSDSSGLSTTAGWTRESNCSTSKYGFSLAACNIKAHAYDDLIVGAPYLDNGQTDEGRVVVYHGKSGGLCTTCGSGDYWLKDSDHTGGRFGYAAACGNFNGDGYYDLAASIPYYTYGETEEGQVAVFNGTGSGLCCMTGMASWVYEPNVPYMRLGGSLAAGSFKNTAWDDLAVGSPDSNVGCNANSYYCGAVDVFDGSYSGLENHADWEIFGHEDDIRLGFSVAAGNIVGDGYDDLFYGIPGWGNQDYPSYNQGYVWLYRGSSSGLSYYWDRTTRLSNQSSFGFSISSGNIDGSGRDEFIVGAPTYWIMDQTGCEGTAFAFMVGVCDYPDYPCDIWDEDSDMASSYYGYAVAMGDFDCDGNSDIAIGAPGNDDLRPVGGYVQVFYSAY